MSKLVMYLFITTLGFCAEFDASRVECKLRDTETEARVVFKYYNNSNQSIKINKAVASCGCMNMHYSTAMIAPGGREEISVDISSQTNSGRTTKTLLVEFSGGQKETHLLTIDIVRRVELNLDPAILYINGDGSVQVRKLYVKCATEHRVASVEVVTSGVKLLDVTNKPDAEGLQIALEFNDHVPNKIELRVQLDDGRSVLKDVTVRTISMR